MDIICIHTWYRLVWYFAIGWSLGKKSLKMNWTVEELGGLQLTITAYFKNWWEKYSANPPFMIDWRVFFFWSRNWMRIHFLIYWNAQGHWNQDIPLDKGRKQLWLCFVPWLNILTVCGLSSTRQCISSLAHCISLLCTAYQYLAISYHPTL